MIIRGLVVGKTIHLVRAFVVDNVHEDEEVITSYGIVKRSLGFT